jgi:hypothetical protein
MTAEPRRLSFEQIQAALAPIPGGGGELRFIVRAMKEVAVASQGEGVLLEDISRVLEEIVALSEALTVEDMVKVLFFQRCPLFTYPAKSKAATFAVIGVIFWVDQLFGWSFYIIALQHALGLLSKEALIIKQRLENGDQTLERTS